MPKEEIKAVLDEIVSNVNVAIESLKVDFA